MTAMAGPAGTDPRPRTPARRVAAAVFAIAAVLALVLLSRVPWRSSDPDTAELRVSWRIPAPSRRQCRAPTEGELSGVLPHMRPSEICSDDAIPFHLTIRLNGDTLHSGTVARSGPRARTITVYRSFAVSPGNHTLEVAFLPEPPPETDPGAETVTSPDSASESPDSPRNLAMTLSTTVSVAPGDVFLVSPDEEGRLLVAPRG